MLNQIIKQGIQIRKVSKHRRVACAKVIGFGGAAIAAAAVFGKGNADIVVIQTNAIERFLR